MLDHFVFSLLLIQRGGCGKEEKEDWWWCGMMFVGKHASLLGPWYNYFITTVQRKRKKKRDGSLPVPGTHSVLLDAVPGTWYRY